MRSGFSGSVEEKHRLIALLDGRIRRARALVLVGSEFLVRRLARCRLEVKQEKLVAQATEKAS